MAGLAGIAGAISYSHMRQLAAAHGDAGWHAHAFPLSVDGVEIVASLVLLADRRSGRRSGWLPWTALTVGTAASLAANVATADDGIVSRLIAGWPAVAQLIAVKLLSGILEHGKAVGPIAELDNPGCGTMLLPAVRSESDPEREPDQRRTAGHPRACRFALRPALTCSATAQPASSTTWPTQTPTEQLPPGSPTTQASTGKSTPPGMTRPTTRLVTITSSPPSRHMNRRQGSTHREALPQPAY